MSLNVLVVNGHPDPRPERFCAALCDAYETGAREAGHATRRLDVGVLHLSSLAAVGEDAEAGWDGLERAFRLLQAADRLAIVYPQWADGPPTELRRLFDTVARLKEHLKLAGDSKAAQVVVTSALPGLFYRGRGPAFEGVAAEEPTYIGSVETVSAARRQRWLAQMRELGEQLP